MDLIIIKKASIIIILLLFLNSCGQNLALLAPVFTLATSGNAYKAGFSYGSNEIIIKKTGKSTIQNLKEAIDANKKNSVSQNLAKKVIIKNRKK